MPSYAVVAIVFSFHRVVLAGTCPLFCEKLAASQADGEEKRSCDEFEIPEQFDKLAVVSVLEFKLVLNVDRMMDLLQLLCCLKIKHFFMKQFLFFNNFIKITFDSRRGYNQWVFSSVFCFC